MKKPVYLIILLSLFISVTRTVAQENQDTTRFLISEKIVFSGIISPFIDFSSVNKEFAVCLGGQGGVLINKTFYIGGYFEGLVTNHYRQGLDSIISKDNPKTEFEHGGIWLGYIYKHNQPIHGGLSMKLGWGEIDLEGDGNNYNPPVDYDYTDKIFTIQPQVEMELNMTKWFRVNIGVGYRFVTGIDATYLDEQGNRVNFYNTSDYSSPVGTISFIFGGRHEHVK